MSTLSDSARVENVHALLLDPVEGATADDVTLQTSIPDQICAFNLGICHVGFAVGSIWAAISSQGGYCSGWVRAWYQILPWLACLSALPGCCYSWAVIKKARPRFMHVAGAFLLANTMALSLMTLFFHGSCTDSRGLRFTVIPAMLFNILAYGFLQYGILLKVEALVAARATVSRLTLFAAAVPGLPFVFLHICVIFQALPWQTMYIEALLLLVVIIFFTMFTVLAARDILRCRELFCNTKVDVAVYAKHRRTLAVHAAVTVAANGTLVLSMGAMVLCLANGFRGAVGWAFVFTQVVDNVLNTICMVLLSGLSAALRSTWGHGDVISEIALAGYEARHATDVTTLGKIDANISTASTASDPRNSERQ